MIAPQMEEEFEVCPVKSNFLCPACVGKVLTFLGANVGANVASNTCRNMLRQRLPPLSNITHS